MSSNRIITLIASILVSLAGYAQNPNDSIPMDTVLLDDGSLYIGQIRNSLFDGRGRCIFPDGTVYEGNWKEGLWNGQGIVVYPDGDIYKGEFLNHIKEGKGTYIYGSGARYDGEWKNDMFNGEGKLFFEDGGRYEGAWKDDMKHGYGKLISPDGRVTQGYFYRDDFLGLPSDTEIDFDSTMTDELISWGFRQEDIKQRTEVAWGVSYGSKGMATFTFWRNRDHIFWGLSLGINCEPPTKGYNSGAIGFKAFQKDVHFTGEFVSSDYLFDIGYISTDRKLAIGGSLGAGLRNEYMNCKANNNPDFYDTYNIKYGTAYSLRSIEGTKFVYRGYLKYSITKEKPKAQVYLGYGNVDGLFLGASWFIH